MIIGELPYLPACHLKYLTLSLLAAPTIEQNRYLSAEHRFAPTRIETLFGRGRVQKVERGNRFRRDSGLRHVVKCDLAYDRLNLHRLEATLESIGVEKWLTKAINDLLSHWSGRDWYIVGGNARTTSWRRRHSLALTRRSRQNMSTSFGSLMTSDFLLPTSRPPSNGWGSSQNACFETASFSTQPRLPFIQRGEPRPLRMPEADKPPAKAERSDCGRWLPACREALQITDRR